MFTYISLDSFNTLHMISFYEVTSFKILKSILDRMVKCYFTSFHVLNFVTIFRRFEAQFKIIPLKSSVLDNS